MKILVIGGSGLVGSHILKAASAAGHSAIGTFRRFSSPGLLPLDCADTNALEHILESEKPDVVIHAAGWTWVDGCEDDPERAFAENAQQPAFIAKKCKSAGVRFVYFSTSYVFDGNSGPYTEEATPNPINVYGKSKLQGERDVLEATEGNAIIARVICVYGAEAQRKNFAYQVWKAMEEGKSLTLPSDQCGNPTYAGDIARWLVMLLEQKAKGIWHLPGPWPECTRPEWAEKLVTAFKELGIQTNDGFGLKSIPTAELKQKALRPLKAGLVSSKLHSSIASPTSFIDSIKQMKRGN